MANEDTIGGAAADYTRIIKDLNCNEAHAFTEELTYKRPCEFMLDGKRYQDVTTFTRLYELVLRQLAKKNSALSKTLPDNPATITRRGNHRITRIRAETNLAANDLCESIRTLLGIFPFPLTSCTILLRQDRDA